MQKQSKIITLVFTLLFFAGFSLTSQTSVSSAPIKVSVFSFPGLTEGDGSCWDEVDNLEEIISKLGYSVDRTITTLQDTGGQTLLARLNASQFFFVPDMEKAFTVSNTSDFPLTAVTAFQTWLNNGGVFVMTGTAGSKDIEFINKVTGWSLSTASVASTTRIDSNVSGTPFDGSNNNVTLGNPSATDGINGSAAPGSANFKPLWGTSSAASVATMDYGAGKIIFLGWDFFDSGYSGVNNYNSSVCGQTSNPWVTKIVPAALEYASQLSGASALTNLTSGGGDLGYTVSQNGTAYIVVVASGSTAPTAAQVKAATNYTGGTILYSSNGSVTSNVSKTFNISGLSPGSDYVAYVVTEYGSPAQFSSITSTSFSTKPGIPTVSSINSGNGQVSVAILPSSTETNFQYSTDGGSNWVARTPASVTSPWTITGLTNGTSYSFLFRSVYKGQSGSSTISYSATPIASVPDAPSGLDGSASSTDGSINLSWTAPNNNGSAISGYLIQSRLVGSSSWLTVADTDGNATNSAATISELTSCAAYEFKVAATNGVGTGNYSTPTSVTSFGSSGLSSLSSNQVVSAGNTVASSGTYTLTPDAPTKSGAIWSGYRLDLTKSFCLEADVQFSATNSLSGADGVAFVLQPSDTTSLSSGGGLGYYPGIKPSIAVEFDTYPNGAGYGDSASGQDITLVSLTSSGTVDWTAFDQANYNVTTNSYQLEDGNYHSIRIRYDANQNLFSVLVDLNADGDFSDTGERVVNNRVADLAQFFNVNANTNYVYWGFTAATGGSTNEQAVKNLKSYPLELAGNTTPTATSPGAQTVDVGGTKNIDISLSDNNETTDRKSVV